jgi:hypothetical protein
MLNEVAGRFTELCRLEDKSGTGHIEMIMGFTFFIATVLFLFILIRVDGDMLEAPDSLLKNLEGNFKDMAETEVTSFFVKLDPEPDPVCISLDLSQYGFNQSLNAVSDYDSKLDSNSLLIESPSSSEFMVSLSVDFIESDPSPCTTFTDFTLGPLIIEKYISIEKIQTLETEYNSDYNSLKSRMGIGSLYDFSIESTSGAIDLSRPISPSVNIYASKNKLSTINENGQKESMEVIFKIW